MNIVLGSKLSLMHVLTVKEQKKKTLSLYHFSIFSLTLNTKRLSFVDFHLRLVRFSSEEILVRRDEGCKLIGKLSTGRDVVL